MNKLQQTLTITWVLICVKFVFYGPEVHGMLDHVVVVGDF